MKKTAKTPIILTAMALALALIHPACADDKHDHSGHSHSDPKDDHDHAGHDHKDHDHDHDHDHGHSHEKIERGPNGGRLLTFVTPHLEFLVNEDRTVTITSVSEKGEAQAMGEQVVSLIGGDRSNPTIMKFTKEGESLVSDTAFPEGDRIPIILTVVPTADGEKVVEKIGLNLAECPECGFEEYVCECDHEH